MASNSNASSENDTEVGSDAHLTHCSIEGCERPILSRSLCGAHYAHQRRIGFPDRLRQGRPKIEFQKCSVVDCDSSATSKGLCKKHYARLLRHGDVEDRPRNCGPNTERERRICTAEGCVQQYHCNGYCRMHWDRMRRHGRLDARPYNPRTQTCSTEGCDRKPRAGGLCGKHYARFRKYGDVMGGKFHHSDHRREWHLEKSGYVWRYEPDNPMAGPNGYVFQHRHLMAEKIGRLLLSNETPHHKNGNRADNRPDNLELWATGQPAGQRVQDLVAWAKDILRLYPDEVIAQLSRGAGS